MMYHKISHKLDLSMVGDKVASIERWELSLFKKYSASFIPVNQAHLHIFWAVKREELGN